MQKLKFIPFSGRKSPYLRWPAGRRRAGDGSGRRRSATSAPRTRARAMVRAMRETSRVWVMRVR